MVIAGNVMDGLELEGELWVVLPTYNEAENLPPMLSAIHLTVPAARILVVDDSSPDGTGALADRAAATDSRIEVLHRAGKEGLGAAYRAGFRHLLARQRAAILVQMDCDFSHDPADLPRLVDAVRGGADVALGSRYVSGGSTPGWGFRRRAISRAGSLFARTVLNLAIRDLTGGFKAWRRPVLEAVLEEAAYASGYGFQIETTWRAVRQGARVVELPITFRDRVVGMSKMDARIAAEAFRMVIAMRATDLRRRRRQL